MCRVNADQEPRPFVIVFVAGALAWVPGARTFIARERRLDDAEAKARKWNAAPADLSYGIFSVESEL